MNENQVAVEIDEHAALFEIFAAADKLDAAWFLKRDDLELRNALSKAIRHYKDVTGTPAGNGKKIRRVPPGSKRLFR